MPVRLSDLTTLGLGGPAPDLLTVSTTAELIEAMLLDDVLVIGGGSNLVIADAGVSVPVVRIAIPGIAVGPERPDGCVDVTIGAGENWAAVVDQLTADGFTGLAPLAGIPGNAGATPVQNVGAYGSEIADTLVSVTVYDRLTCTVKAATAADLELGYRTSAIRGTDRAVVLDITLRLGRAPTVVTYAELARTLGIEPGTTAPESDIRDAVIGLRRGKGMLIEPGVDDPDNRSAGSFFTNPILDTDQAEQTDRAIRAVCGSDTSYPRYPAGVDTKLSAAWLIERAGFGKGYSGPGGRVAVSSKHTLALVNRNGTTADLLTLAREIRDGVRRVFGVQLHPEPVLVGVWL